MNYKLLGYWLLGCYALPVHAEGIQPSFINGPKLYVGGSVGGSQQGDSCNDPFFEGSCDNKDTSWKVFGGVRLNPMTGAEITYHELGTAKMNGVSGGTYASMKNSVSGTSISGVGYVPMAQGLEAFAKAGAMFWERETTQSTSQRSEKNSDNGTNPLLGLGAQYQLNNNLHVRGEWEHTFNVGSDSAYETDVDQYTVGMMYSTL